jgi:hypothetical protein
MATSWGRERTCDSAGGCGPWWGGVAGRSRDNGRRAGGWRGGGGGRGGGRDARLADHSQRQCDQPLRCAGGSGLHLAVIVCGRGVWRRPPAQVRSAPGRVLERHGLDRQPGAGRHRKQELAVERGLPRRGGVPGGGRVGLSCRHPSPSGGVVERDALGGRGDPRPADRRGFVGGGLLVDQGVRGRGSIGFGPRGLADEAAGGKLERLGVGSSQAARHRIGWAKWGVVRGHVGRGHVRGGGRGRRRTAGSGFQRCRLDQGADPEAHDPCRPAGGGLHVQLVVRSGGLSRFPEPGGNLEWLRLVGATHRQPPKL